MKYVIFSDVHGNAYALEKMLQDLDQENNIEGFIYCGDIAGYYYGQERVVSFIRKLNNLHIVKGNHDCYLELSNKDKTKQKKLAVKYGNSYLNSDTLSAECLEYIYNLPEQKRLVIAGKSIGIFHGTPLNALEGRYYPDSVQCELQFEGVDVAFLGHTHYRMTKTLNNTFIVNPGSLGQPRDGNGFSYCIFDFKTMQCRFKTVKFELNHLIEEITKIETNDNRKKYLNDVLFRR